MKLQNVKKRYRKKKYHCEEVRSNEPPLNLPQKGRLEKVLKPSPLERVGVRLIASQ
jgi:hypothetical protein